MAVSEKTVYKRRPKKAKDFLKIYPTLRCNITKSCESVGISRQTYYNWIDYLDNFERDLNAAKEGLKDKIEDKILDRALIDGNIKALELVANAMLGDRGYKKEKTEVEVTVHPLLELMQKASVVKKETQQ